MPPVAFAEGTLTSTVLYTASTPIPSGGSVTLTGDDAARFNVNASTGAVPFNAVPNFEAPTDTGADNVYDVTLEVRDSTNAIVSTEALSVTVTDVAPGVVSGTTASVNEGVAAGSTVYTAVASDTAGGTVVYSIGGGADAAKFNISSSSGAVSFVSAPDFESPADV